MKHIFKSTRLKQCFVLIIFVLSIASCSTTEIDDSIMSQSNQSVQSKPQKVARIDTSVDFDWENINFVSIAGSNIALPWVGGASSTVPAHIQAEMSKSYGWDLMYNTIYWNSNNGYIGNQNYLIFYNKFTGILRFFIYNKIATSSSQGLFNFKIVSNVPTTLLNGISGFSAVAPKLEPSCALTNSPADAESTITGFRNEWNYFDVPLVYDPNINKNTKLKFSLVTDQKTISDFDLSGTFTSKTNGQLITESTSNPTNSTVKSLSTAAGTKALGLLDSIVKKTINPTSLIAKIAANAATAGISDLVSTGISSLFKSFTGRFNSTQSLSQKIKLTTEGQVKLTGSLITGSPGVINSMNLVALPGTDYSDGGLVPSNDINTFGVWTIDNQPIVYHDQYAVGTVSGHYLTQKYIMDNNSFNVIINPNVLNSIDRFTVSKELWFHKEPYTDDCFPSDGELIFYNSSNLEKMYRNGTIINMENVTWNDDYPNTRVKKSEVVLKSFEVKITVTLYPKAPYDSAPIVLVRTYLPKYVVR
jgi:hypothetical protein